MGSLFSPGNHRKLPGRCKKKRKVWEPCAKNTSQLSSSSRMIDRAQFGGDKRGHKSAQILSNAPGLLIKLAANVSVIDRYRELHLSSSSGVCRGSG